ncbi:MAG: hypothetical protein ACHQT8_03025, partial [Chlamydiales bacterium]
MTNAIQIPIASPGGTLKIKGKPLDIGKHEIQTPLNATFAHRDQLNFWSDLDQDDSSPDISPRPDSS